MSEITAWAIYSRDSKRHRAVASDGAHVEFEHPRPGPQWRLALVNVSRGGVSFDLGDGLSGLETGTRVSRFVIRTCEHEVCGEFEASHVTFEDGRTVCGGRFYPATAADDLALKQLITSLARLHPR